MVDTQILERMAHNDPVKSYQKTILGKLYVVVFNSINGTSEGIILEGDPKKGEGTVQIWSQLEDAFFRRANKALFDQGFLTEYTKPLSFEKSPNEKTDEEIEALYDERFLTFQRELEKITSMLTLERFLVIGESTNKSPRYIEFVKKMIANLQKQEFEVKEDAD